MLNEREMSTIFLLSAGEYLKQVQIKAYNLRGDERFIIPCAEDFSHHRSYQYKDLTTRGTVEFRSTCVQPLTKTFAPATFHLGLLVNLEETEAYLKACEFFRLEGRDYKHLRRQYSKNKLTQNEEKTFKNFHTIFFNLLSKACKNGKCMKKSISYLCINRLPLEF